MTKNWRQNDIKTKIEGHKDKNRRTEDRKHNDKELKTEGHKDKNRRTEK